MMLRARFSLAGLLSGGFLAAAGLIAPLAQAATFGVAEANFEAGTCVNHTCKYAGIKKELAEKGHSNEAFTQSAGHPAWGITAFKLNEEGGAPVGALKRVRVDIPEGLAANPQALPKCEVAAFKEEGGKKCAANTEVGTNELTAHNGLIGNLEVTGTVYNLEPPAGLPLYFGVHVEALGGAVNEHVLLEGHVSWHKEAALEKRGIASGDYHEWFEIKGISKENPVLKSQLNFNGHAGIGNFLTLPTRCSKSTTSYLEVESWEGQASTTSTTTPIGVEGCANDPFEPSAEITPETTQSDLPDGATTLLTVNQFAGSGEINTADIKDVSMTLPEGLTLNPSAAHGLQTCSPAQIAIGSESPVSCPAASKVGTLAIETDLPPHSLAGSVFLGNPGGGAITGPPFTVYIDAEAPAYGISVRLEGQVTPDPLTGRLVASFANNPQLPFSSLTLTLNGGARAPLANPLACGTGHAETAFTPFDVEIPSWKSVTPFATTGCPAFTWAQSTSEQPTSAGAFGSTSYTFNLARSDGQQYLAKVSTALPLGLVGAIPAVSLCAEPQAAKGTCAGSSQIGTATVSAGAGAEPYSFTGPVYLTGPYGGGPFGLSIAVPAVAGPFNFGTVVTRAAITIDPHTARVSVTSSLPTIVKGVPLRLKSISVNVSHANFLYNPTSCGALQTETMLTSVFAATQSLSSPFQPTGCGALTFSPSFTVSTSANTSKAGGASLQVNLTQPPHQANIRSVVTQLPLQLPSRLSTLQQACLAVTYAANPFSCPAGSNVGTATVTTPVLPGTLSGPAYLVSHGSAEFPDLDLVLEGSGVRVLLEGSTAIKGGVTTSTFASLPDVPVSSFSLSLPMGPHSALAAYGKLCEAPLYMPTTITAQNGAQIKQNTRVAVVGCASGGGSAGEEGIVGGRRLFKILSRRVVHHTLLLRIKTFVAGRLSAAGGRYVSSASRRLRKPTTVTLKLKLTRRGLHALRKHHPLKIRVRVTLTPPRRGERAASARTSVAFRR